MDGESIGIVFSNDLPYTEEFNTYTYRNFYNGGGVAVGDINNDGLPDIYFMGNIADNKLYLNKGNWQFEDITEVSGLACKNVWSTGACMVDINGDGLLDIYVCKAGKPGGPNRHNELFINNGNLTFTEKSKEYGLDIEGLSIHSAFFDYDKDGDLDCYILNNSIRSVGGFDLKRGLREIPDPEGNKFMENVDGKFIDKTQEAGFYSSNIGYGLGITLSDFNQDNWTDVFISNDFFERDYLYLNNQDGTFREVAENSFGSLSMGSMGADACDIDNDLLPDLFVTEMLPESLERKKTKAIYDNWNKYSFTVKEGYHHQFPRNVLQKNIGQSEFLELGRLSGVAASEWSWASLIQDFDNDGLKDLFISNGIYKDLLDKDYLNFYANDLVVKTKIANREILLTSLIDSIPSKPVKNSIYKNLGNFNFEYKSDEWGFDEPTFSNGSAYGDFDNDGDLDLVVNNVNMISYIYRNNLDTSINRSLQIKLKGHQKNTFAIGAKVLVKYKGGQSLVENYTSKGFESSVDNRLHIGVGNTKIVDSLIITWPDNRVSVYTELATNKFYEFDQSQAIYNQPILENQTRKGYRVTDFEFEHEESDVNLFARERLLLEMGGFMGPALAVGDINGDGYDDLFVGGGKKQSDVLYLSGGSSSSFRRDTTAFTGTDESETVAAEFFDSDNDGDLDLYVGNGGKTISSYSTLLHDRLYINDGFGNFTLKSNALAFSRPVHTGNIAIGDLDGDGLSDLVIAEKMINDMYGLPGSVVVMINQGDNTYKEIESEEFSNIGMISDIGLSDINGDEILDIFCVGKWMPVTILINDGKGLKNSFSKTTMQNSSGLWNCMEMKDLDEDGDLDFICGNEGQNTFMNERMKLFIYDFDHNGRAEQIFCEEKDGRHYPVNQLDELYSQLPMLKKKYLFYKNLAKASLEEMFGLEALSAAMVFNLDELRSGIFVNTAGSFEFRPLPNQIQFSSVYAIESMQGNKNKNHFFIGGNNYTVKPQFGRQDASLGWELQFAFHGDSLEVDFCDPLFIKGQIRDIEKFNDKILFGINNENIKILEKVEYE